MEPQLKKIFYLDNLKVFLTILVVLHHIAITYGADGGWFYKEVEKTVMPDSLILTTFAALNQTYFMGLFFFISGLFLIRSLERKSTTQFLKERFIRLGLPTLLFIFFMYPLAIWTIYYPKSASTLVEVFVKYTRDASLGNTGPAWFIFVLFVLNILALAFKTPLIKAAQGAYHFDYNKILLSIGGLAILNFIVRLYFPDGVTVYNVQIAYLPQYIIYFFAGALIGTGHSLKHLLQQRIKFWLFPSTVLFTSVFITLAVELDTTPFRGGFKPEAILYTITQAFLSIGLSICLLVFFHRHANHASWLNGYLARGAYGTYYIHTLVIVIIAMAVQSIQLTPMLKFLVVAPFGVLFSIIGGDLLTRIPLIKKLFS